MADGWGGRTWFLAGQVRPNAQNAPSHTDVIVVTAQKQEQAANTVGMSITAATGDELQARGIEGVQDLPRLVPGLTIQHSALTPRRSPCGV